MNKKNTLGYAIFNGIEKNEYLNELYDALLFNYCRHIFHSSSVKKKLDLNDLLRFADLLSKSVNVDNSEMHHSLAQEIVTLLRILEPDNLLVKDTVGAVLSQLNNYLGLSHAAPDYYEPSILERITNEYEKSLLQIPFEQDKYFLRSQKYVYDYMNEEVFFSYSGPTSMGKSFVMRTFIRDKIKKNDSCNFAVIVPTRALINEIFRALAEDMSGILRENDYRIVTSSGNSIVKDKNKHRYIFVMTPERMMYKLIEYPDIPVHYVFIDEAQNISKKDGRSAYYYQIVNMLMQNKTQPHIIFASPHIPNPEVYLGVAAANIEAKSLSSVFTPVSQEKFLIDMNSGTYGYYNPLSAQLKTVGKFPEMSLSMIVDQFGAGKRNLVYCNFKSAVVSSAVRYSKLLRPENDAELIEHAQEIREQVHPDYYLAYTVERGVAFHVSYIPPNIRIRIEELFRKKDGGINVIFCTSTLLEGVNMPADNLFITDYRNGYNPLSDVEFRNLTGRVGRLQYSLYGNVFLICMKDEEISPQSYVELLQSGIKKQTLSVSDLSDEAKQYIVESLTSGTTKLMPLAEQTENDFAFMRKTAGILLRDIMSGRSSMVRQEFESFLLPEKIKAIREIFASRDNELDDDINVSLDQIDSSLYAAVLFAFIKVYILSMIGGYNMAKKQDSGLSCFMIVMKFHGIPITKEQAENLSVLDPEQKTREIEIIQSAKALKMKAKLCSLKIKKLKDINSPIIAKGNDDEFFIIAKSQDDKFMILHADKPAPEVVTRDELAKMWDGTAIIINKKGVIDREAAFSFKWFIPTILKFKKEFIQVLIAVFTVQILGILPPVMTQVVVDKVLVHRSISTLNVLTIGIAIVYIYELILGLAKNYVFTHTTNRIDVMLSFRLFKHLFALPLKYFESRRVGETVARVRELDSIRNFLTGTPLSSMIDLIFIIVYIVVLFCYSKMLTVIVICSIPVYAILSAIVTPLFKKRLDEKFETGANTQSFLVESITGVQTVKSYALEPKFEKKWGDLQADYVKASYKTSMVSATAGTTGQFIQKVFDLLILFFGAKAVMDGNFTVGQLVAFRMLSGRVSGPVLRLVQLWQEYQQASLSVKRIGDIFNTAPEPILNTNQTSMPRVQGKIVFDQVHFRYNPQGGEVIKGMSFEIPAGMVVGVVGRSGSGKSTISKLIQRLYIPEAGKISVDGMDISLVNPAMLRKQIGVVLQENFMFNGTVAENISIHCPTATMDRIIECAKIAGAHDFILELPNGYDTIIGEKGMGLSGGQKQRVAIARAILNDPRILIFDEATSALDYESESIIQNNLKEICKNRTVIIIAHRLSTLKDAQKIMVIDKGDLVEYDTHEKLMAMNGLYAYLYNQQQRGEVDG